jgi:hypothetical protein
MNKPMASTDNIVATRMRGVRHISRILLAIQVLSLGHLLLVRHVTCPQHGDIIHAHSAELSSPVQSVERPTSLPGAALAAPVAVDGDHDHCQVCTESNRRFAVLPPATPVLGDVTLAISTPRPDWDEVFAPIDLIRLCPKSSPPTA